MYQAMALDCKGLNLTILLFKLFKRGYNFMSCEKSTNEQTNK